MNLILVGRKFGDTINLLCGDFSYGLREFVWDDVLCVFEWGVLVG